MHLTTILCCVTLLSRGAAARQQQQRQLQQQQQQQQQQHQPQQQQQQQQQQQHHQYQYQHQQHHQQHQHQHQHQHQRPLLDDATSCLQQQAHAGQREAPRQQHTSQPGAKQGPETALPGAEVEEFAVQVASDQRSASITFTVEKKEYRYLLGRFSIFSLGAKVLRHTEGGEVPVKGGEVPQTYRAQSRSRAATLTVEPDGRVLAGLFKFQGSYYQVEPRNESLQAMPVSLAALRGRHQRRQRGFEGHRLSVVEKTAAALPPITAESTVVHAGRYDILVDAVDEGNHWHGIPVTESHSPTMETERQRFAGTVWYPGCYSGDSSTHVMKVGIVGDVQAHAEYGASLQAMLIDYVSKASLVFAGQMNVELEIAYSMIYETAAAGAPPYADGCGTSGAFGGADPDATFSQNLYDMVGYYPWNIPAVAALHMFSGCAPNWGIIGLAFVGAACESPWSVGINKIRDDPSQDLFPYGTWLTFAHELGHNIGAQHSFEEGQETTGGIMDYGNGTLDGVYQFNTQYRRTEVCQKLNEWVGQCNGAFEVAAVEPASATGDPHIRNIRGRSFDIHHVGRIRLLQIPKISGEGASAPSQARSLLVVDAESVHNPGTCKGVYLVSINISGTWALERQKEGFQFAANIKQASSRHPHHKVRMLLGPGLRLLVSHGKTHSGEAYLNFHAHELSRAAQSIGGLLGEDDDEEYRLVERFSDDCISAPDGMNFLLLRERGHFHPPGGGRSFLTASLGGGDEHDED